jgi:membrane protein DedA with SNARE-associated domain/membrane-associated phospholipid phosphatase
MGWIAEHVLSLSGWAALAIVFALPALEASALVGVVVPGELAVLLGGVLASEQRVSLAAVICAAVAGAVIGDSVGYLVGRRFGPRLVAGRAGRLVRPDQLARARRLLRERGGAAVLLGRFTAALRALIPGLAGMAGMPYRTFALNNVVGGTVWATGFVLLGYLAGSSWRVVERVAGRASLLLILVAAVVAVVALGARWVAGHQERVRGWAARVVQRPVVGRLRARYQAQLAFMGRRLRPGQARGLSLTVAFAGLAAVGLAFGALLQDVLGGEESALLDRPVLSWLVVHREPWLTAVLAWVTDLGASWFLVPLVLVAGLAWRWRTGGWQPLGMLAAAYGGAWLLSKLVKSIVGRPRPPLATMAEHVTGMAFPSGHATNSAAVYGMLAVLAGTALGPWRAKVGAWAGLVLVVLAVGFSRLYLGVHWLTDVLAGWALGAAWVLVLVAGVRIRVGAGGRRQRRGRTGPGAPPRDDPAACARRSAA